MEAPEMHHRHISHCYALHPSEQITVEDTPELAAAARRTLEIRGDESTGWGIAWRLNFWARLADGNHVHELLKLLLSPQRTYRTVRREPPLQIRELGQGRNCQVNAAITRGRISCCRHCRAPGRRAGSPGCVPAVVSNAM